MNVNIVKMFDLALSLRLLGIFHSFSLIFIMTGTMIECTESQMFWHYLHSLDVVLLYINKLA